MRSNSGREETTTNICLSGGEVTAGRGQDEQTDHNIITAESEPREHVLYQNEGRKKSLGLRGVFAATRCWSPYLPQLGWSGKNCAGLEPGGGGCPRLACDKFPSKDLLCGMSDPQPGGSVLCGPQPWPGSRPGYSNSFGARALAVGCRDLGAILPSQIGLHGPG